MIDNPSEPLNGDLLENSEPTRTSTGHNVDLGPTAGPQTTLGMLYMNTNTNANTNTIGYPTPRKALSVGPSVRFFTRSNANACM